MKYVFSPCQTTTSTTLAGHEKLDTCRPQNVVGQVGRKKKLVIAFPIGHQEY